MDCRKPRREQDTTQRPETKVEANLAQVHNDEPTLLLTEWKEPRHNTLLLNEEGVMPRIKKEDENRAESNFWYLDNGASNHMTGCRSKFTELDEGVQGQVKFGDGSVVEIRGKGSVSFRGKNGENRTFGEVYYIPNLCSNIISLGELSEEGNKVVLSGYFLWIYDERGRLLMKVKRSGNRLYKVLLKPSERTCLMESLTDSSRLWHSRLGHVNYQAIKLMADKNMVMGLPKDVQPGDVCTGCLMSKQARKPFPSQSNFRAKKALELVHCDLCGPIAPATHGGKRYFLLIVDDYTRIMWIYLLTSKDEAFVYFEKFRALVEQESENRIKFLRTDSGGEFCSRQFSEYCEMTGVQRHFTAPYTPQQNGVVERRNRTIVAMK